MKKGLEKNIITRILVKRDIPRTFLKIIEGFDKKYSNFDFQKYSFNISDYFGAGLGQVTATTKLLSDGRIQKDWLRTYKTKEGNNKTDIMGLYIFLNDDNPFYVGISKGIIGRIFQHVKGHNHNSSTLAYNIGLIRYELLNKGNKHLGKRKELNFKTEVEPVKEFLMKQRIAFLPIDNYEELNLFEIYCSMKLKTILNKFETH
jgi:predicted GIY-YIG superfamily endonuclease